MACNDICDYINRNKKAPRRFMCTLPMPYGIPIPDDDVKQKMEEKGIVTHFWDTPGLREEVNLTMPDGWHYVRRLYRHCDPFKCLWHIVDGDGFIHFEIQGMYGLNAWAKITAVEPPTKFVPDFQWDWWRGYDGKGPPEQ